MSYSRVLPLINTDESLIERCRTRDQRAYGEIVDRYKHSVFSYVYRMSGNETDAEDLTQEVFIRLFSSLDSFRQQSSLKTWVFRIAGNICIDRYRRQQKHKAIAFSLDDPISEFSQTSESTREIADVSYDPAKCLDQSETAGRIQAALSELPEKLRSVVVLFDIEGMPYEEIAAVLGCPLGTVKSRLFTARMHLRKRLKSYLEPPND